MGRKWTEEQKAKQALLIRRWQPWQHSTGAKTAAGKAKSSQNARFDEAAAVKELKQTYQELDTILKKFSKLARRKGLLEKALFFHEQ